MDDTVSIRFYEELNLFLPKEKRKVDFLHRLSQGQTVKDMVESEGVPHTEVDLILVNGESVGFRHKLQGGDRISVYPVFERLDISGVTRLQERPLRNPQFVLDVHLRKLAKMMRLLGLDVDYQAHRDDPELAEISRREHRILLTRDRGLLKRSIVTHGLYVHQTDPKLQIKEVIEKLELKAQLKPFTRCTQCNGILYGVDPQSMEHEEILYQVPKGVKKEQKAFFRCRDCKKIYWQGSHVKSIELWMDTLNLSNE